MKLQCLLFICVLFVSITLFTEAYSITKDLLGVDRTDNSLIYLLKRKVNKKKKKETNKKKKKQIKKKKYDHNCSTRSCALVLKPCPKGCPLTCGYINSPDPCCPLLGTPTCPDL